LKLGQVLVRVACFLLLTTSSRYTVEGFRSREGDAQSNADSAPCASQLRPSVSVQVAYLCQIALRPLNPWRLQFIRNVSPLVLLPFSETNKLGP
jgi:hypothetical protein